MADPRALVAGLKDYRDSLRRHLSSVQSEFEVLRRRWDALNSVYEGRAAEEFGEAWQRTIERFTEYIERTHRILDVLEHTIEDLHEYDRPEM